MSLAYIQKESNRFRNLICVCFIFRIWMQCKTLPWKNLPQFNCVRIFITLKLTRNETFKFYVYQLLFSNERYYIMSSKLGETFKFSMLFLPNNDVFCRRKKKMFKRKYLPFVRKLLQSTNDELGRSVRAAQIEKQHPIMGKKSKITETYLQCIDYYSNWHEYRFWNTTESINIYRWQFVFLIVCE